MRMAAWLLVVALGAAFTGDLTRRVNVTAREPGGWVEEIRGPAFWQESPAAREVRLDPQRHRRSRLYAGERVRCGSGGFLRLQLYGRAVSLHGPSGWYPIPRVPLKRRGPAARAMDEYFRLGGRERGSGTWIFSPAPRSAIRPDRLVLRWVPRPQMRVVSLAIGDERGRELWRQDGIDGLVGQLVSNAARQALVRYRADGGQETLLFTLTDLDGNASEARFSLLSSEDEETLERELAQWNGKPPGSLVCHLGRIHAFRDRRMFTEVAEEYEAALAETPRSQDLLIAALLAHRRTGNVSREKALRRRLPPGVQLPD